MTKIEQHVMAAVATVYIARRLSSRTALECYALFLSALCVALLVSLPHVATNFLAVAAGGLPNVAAYLVSSIVGTKLVVQLALVLGALSLLALTRDAVRSGVMPKFA